MNDITVLAEVKKQRGAEATAGEAEKTSQSETWTQPSILIPSGWELYPQPQVAYFHSGGGNGDMEARVARLESDVEHIKNDIGDIKIDIREIRSGLSGIITEIAESKNSLIKFSVFLSIALVGVLFAMMSYLKL